MLRGLSPNGSDDGKVVGGRGERDPEDILGQIVAVARNRVRKPTPPNPTSASRAACSPECFGRAAFSEARLWGSLVGCPFLDHVSGILAAAPEGDR